MKKIPIVEDDQLIGSAYKMRFQEPGYEVERAPDGFDRINLVGAVKSEVVLLDRLMPGLDGIEAVVAGRPPQIARYSGTLESSLHDLQQKPKFINVSTARTVVVSVAVLEAPFQLAIDQFLPSWRTRRRWSWMARA